MSVLKPKLRSLIIATLKNGKEIYLDYRFSVDDNGKLSKFLYPHFPNEYTVDVSWKNIKSWKYVFDEKNREEFFKYKEYWRWYWGNHSEDLKIQNPRDEIDEMYNSWISDLKHIEFLEQWIDGIGFSDGEIENPSYSVGLIFRSGALQTLQRLNKTDNIKV